MKLKKHILFHGLIAAILLCAIPSCKPSEKNYKAAYEMAQKKEHEGLDDELFAKIKSENMPKLIILGGDSVNMAPQEPILISWQPGSENKFVAKAPLYNLVVGEYRNPTNAKAHALHFMPISDGIKQKKPKKGEILPADTIPAGWDWYPMVLVQSADDRYYVAIAHGDSVNELLPALRLFKERGYSTVGIETPTVYKRQ